MCIRDRYVVDEYKKEELDLYNPEDRIEYLLEKIWQRIAKLDMSWKTKLQIEAIDCLLYTSKYQKENDEIEKFTKLLFF